MVAAEPIVLVLATNEAGLPAATSRLRDLGIANAELAAPGEARRLLLASIPDEADGARIVARLQAEGHAAVSRPSSGTALEAWVGHTSPIVVGDRLTVCFAWSEHDRAGFPGVVELDPAGGFGTGRHPSTRLLLDALERRIHGGERVLDVGGGSGVLGISALRLGASSLLAVDTDARAIAAIRHNAVLNGVDGVVDASAVPLGEVDGVFDVTVANIGWAALIELAPDLVARLASGGWLGVSGIAPGHCARVAAALRPLKVFEAPSDGEWSALILARSTTA